MNDEVHRTHCCAGVHGCKYSEDDCPVEKVRIAPVYKCQDCEDMRESMVFTPLMIEAIYAAWHGAGVDIAGGNWERFVGMLPGPNCVTMDRFDKAPWPDMPQEPPPGLLMSMAIRFDHALGIPGYYNRFNALAITPPGPTHAERLESTLRTMRQIYEEVSGQGFYSKANEPEYAALAGSKTPNV